MRILLTTPYCIWPTNSGGAVRTTQLAKGLSRLGHEVILLSAEPVGPAGELGDSVHRVGFPHQGRFGHFWNPGFSRALRAIVDKGVDLVVAGFPYQALMMTGVLKRAGIPLVYDAHNVEYDRFRQMGQPARAALVRIAETRMLMHSQAVLAVSQEDAQIFAQLYGNHRLTLLPNGVDVEKFSPGPSSPELSHKYGLDGRHVLLFFGALDYHPNQLALRFLVEDLWPRLSVKRQDTCLMIVGRNPPAWITRDPRIIITGAVDDIVDHVRLADLVLAPIISGGGTRLKILESLACAQPVVSTGFGAMGISSKSIPGLVLSDTDNFLESVLDSLNEQSGQQPKKGARALAESFSWDALVSDVDWQQFVAQKGN